LSHNIFVAKFDDGLRMYGINNGTACHMYAFLFQSREEAEYWLVSNARDSRIPVMPKNASMTDENVTIGPDEDGLFAPEPHEQLMDHRSPENVGESWEDQSIYGGCS
jgi:hypothetical protein